MRYLEVNMKEMIKVDNKSTIYWYHEPEIDNYRVVVTLFNREIYRKNLDRKNYNIYYNYINERVKLLLRENLLYKDYTMILLDNSMYRVVDRDLSHFKELVRYLVPVDAMVDLETRRFDLVLDCTMSTGEIFDETDLVYHNGAFYNNGYRIKDIRDMERDGIEYNEWDLMNGITNEQLSYIVSDYYSRDFTNYITEDVNVNVDRWY